MTDILRSLNIHLIRHVPVINPYKIWYGATIDYDDSSESIVEYFQMLADTLPTNPDTTLWLSSPYPRAKATANGVLNKIGAERKPTISLCDAFIEQQYGVMTGKRHEEIVNDPTVSGYLNDMWGTAPKDGESLKMLQMRVGTTLDNLAESTPPHITDIVIFSHGGVAMAAFSHATGQRMIDVFKNRKLDKTAGLTPSFSYQSNLCLPWSNGVWDKPVYTSGLSKDIYQSERKLS